jgi:hypothetical protein
MTQSLTMRGLIAMAIAFVLAKSAPGLGDAQIQQAAEAAATLFAILGGLIAGFGRGRIEPPKMGLQQRMAYATPSHLLTRQKAVGIGLRGLLGVLLGGKKVREALYAMVREALDEAMSETTGEGDARARAAGRAWSLADDPPLGSARTFREDEEKAEDAHKPEHKPAEPQPASNLPPALKRALEVSARLRQARA